MNTDELDRLIHDYLEGTLDVEDAETLNAWLEESAEARQRYWEAASVHGMLEDALQQASLRVVTGVASPGAPDRRVSWPRWRPWTAAAAGVAFGILGASMVWAYAPPLARRVPEREVAVLSEGFEAPAPAPRQRFPREADVWSGNLSAPVAEQSGVKPVEGDRMVRLTPFREQRYGYAWRIVDLADYPEVVQAGACRLEVTAAFNSSDETGTNRYQIRLAAFSQHPTEVHEIWNDEPVLFDTVLQHVGRNVQTQAEDAGWQTVRATMEVPPGTRSVVISLAASGADDTGAEAERYLDDVQARLVVTREPAD